MFPKTQADFFSGSVHLVFAVVIAQGFLIASNIFIPLSNLYSFNGAVSALGLVFAYFFLASSWIGFYKSVSDYPHKENKKGIARYAIAILITFLIYNMISLTDPKNSASIEEIFWVIPLIFFVLMINHAIKYREYVDEVNRQDKKQVQNIIYQTAGFLIIFIVQAVVYWVLNYYVPDLKWYSHTTWVPVFILSSLLLTLWYRYLTWKRYYRTKRKKRNTSV
ncbi:MAG: hypothetical protein ACRDFB_10470 [Rhabdochlamydiaceae bacterium]